MLDREKKDRPYTLNAELGRGSRKVVAVVLVTCTLKTPFAVDIPLEHNLQNAEDPNAGACSHQQSCL